ncbi:rhodanese-like domain-containing protein [Maribacter sp. CXY002]|uniref:rhodanese-like domain-containing protein n=1 Tax=Maribacter luteocoastalis TaxID=3407671 RepID=UPI003B673699
MRFILSILLFALLNSCGHGQKGIDRALKLWNKESVPYIYPMDISLNDTFIFLDTREKEEFNVSHLKNALWVGYKDFDKNLVLNQIPDKSQNIIVYCSIGIRSENIGEKLKALGYTNVLNLYGGIFSWKNNNRAVYNSRGQETDSVHAFNKHWGKLLDNGIKVYDN